MKNKINNTIITIQAILSLPFLLVGAICFEIGSFISTVRIGYDAKNHIIN